MGGQYSDSGNHLEVALKDYEVVSKSKCYCDCDCYAKSLEQLRSGKYTIALLKVLKGYPVEERQDVFSLF